MKRAEIHTGRIFVSGSDRPAQADGQRQCKRCLRWLPSGGFYRSGHRLDCYCKTCRRDISHEQRAGRGSDGAVTYPVITQVADRGERLALILHAKQVVRESMRQKRLLADAREDAACDE